MKRKVLIIALLTMGFVSCVTKDKQRNENSTDKSTCEKMESLDSTRVSVVDTDSIQAFLGDPVDGFTHFLNQWSFADKPVY